MMLVTRDLSHLNAAMKADPGLSHSNSISTFIIKIEPCHEKTNILVSDLVRLKPGCTATEGG